MVPRTSRYRVRQSNIDTHLEKKDLDKYFIVKCSQSSGHFAWVLLLCQSDGIRWENVKYVHKYVKSIFERGIYMQRFTN